MKSPKSEKKSETVDKKVISRLVKSAVDPVIRCERD